MLKRRCLDLIFVLVSAACIPAAAQQDKFAGTWEAKFKGDVFMTLTFKTGDTMSGTMSGGHIEVNKDGDITQASGGGDVLPISNVKLEGDKLSFDLKLDEETEKLVMKITGDAQAELQFLSIPEDVKMKPIRLTKT